MMIGITIIILIMIFQFRDKIFSEIQLIRQKEAKDLLDKGVLNFFCPLTQEERLRSARQLLEKVQDIQKRVQKSSFAKYLVDYRTFIHSQQKFVDMMQSKMELYGHDMISFSSPELNNIMAEGEFSEEQLLQFGCLLDTAFNEDEEMGNCMLKQDENVFKIEMNPYGCFCPNKKEVYRQFVYQVSKDLFQNGKVVMHIEDSEHEEPLEIVSHP